MASTLFNPDNSNVGDSDAPLDAQKHANTQNHKHRDGDRHKHKDRKSKHKDKDRERSRSEKHGNHDHKDSSHSFDVRQHAEFQLSTTPRSKHKGHFDKEKHRKDKIKKEKHIDEKLKKKMASVAEVESSEDSQERVTQRCGNLVPGQIFLASCVVHSAACLLGCPTDRESR
uniref:DNA topoisomerase 1-like n=1 Tax=Myxine glutinosa TaxID=7769 RepID=UPI0035901ED2